MAVYNLSVVVPDMKSIESFVDVALLESPHALPLSSRNIASCDDYAMQGIFGNHISPLQVLGSTLFVKRRRDGRVAEGGGLLNRYTG